MSQQINLFDPSLLRKRELLTAANLAIASVALMLLLATAGGIARSRLAELKTESQTYAPQAMLVKAQKDAMAAQLAAMKPNPQIEAELAATHGLLDSRTRQLSELKKGLGMESGGFAEFLRGFARQTPSGLWLTGFEIAEGGAAMKIRGRMTDPALLADYIRRLNGEHAFKGREFSAVKVAAGKPDETPNASPVADEQQSSVRQGPSTLPTPATPPPYYEFTLSPVGREPAAVVGRPLGVQR